MMEFMHTVPSNTARLDGGKELPASWQITGEAFGYTDWSVEVLGEIRHVAGDRVAVLLRTPLGVLTGPAVILEQRADSSGFLSRLVGADALTYEAPASPPNAEPEGKAT